MTTCPRCAWFALGLGSDPNPNPSPSPSPSPNPNPNPNPNLNRTAASEQAAFYMVGPIEEVVEKAAAMAAELEAEGK